MKVFNHLKQFICFFISLILFFIISNCSFAQNNLPAEKWQEDVTFLKNIVETKYSNLFYKVTKEQFESAADELYRKIPGLSENEIRLGFFKLIAMFKFGHTHMGFRAGEGDGPTPMFHQIPLRFYYFSDGVYISSVSAKYSEALGGKVLKIGNTGIDEVLSKYHDVISTENEEFFKSNIQYYLFIPEFLHALRITDSDDKVSITYLIDGNEKTIVMDSDNGNVNFGNFGLSLPDGWVDSYSELNKPSSVLWMKEPGKFRYFEYLPDQKILYVRHSIILEDPKSETIKQFFENVFNFVDSHDVDKFVLDIRLNGGGNNYLNKSIITGLIRSRNINRYGHLFVITGKATFSAAQNLTNNLEKFTEAIFVGEPTAENVNFYGDTREEILPNSKMRARLSWLWWQDLDPRDKRVWTAPQLAALMSFNDYKNGYDSSMNVIMRFHDDTSLIERITNLIETGKYDDALSAAKDYNNDPVHRYFKADIEEPLNSLGYVYMGQNKFEEASKTLYINMMLYPESANTYDSYAESLLKLDKKEEALKYYEISSSKDAGATGDNSRKMIEMIKSGK